MFLKDMVKYFDLYLYNTIKNQICVGANLKPVMQIYTSSGEKISSFVWDKGKLVGMGWTENEKLICVLQYAPPRKYQQKNTKKGEGRKG